MTGEWFYETKSQRHRDRIHGSDIIRASIRQRKPVTVCEWTWLRVLFMFWKSLLRPSVLHVWMCFGFQFKCLLLGVAVWLEKKNMCLQLSCLRCGLRNPVLWTVEIMTSSFPLSFLVSLMNHRHYPKIWGNCRFVNTPAHHVQCVTDKLFHMKLFHRKDCAWMSLDAGFHHSINGFC